MNNERRKESEKKTAKDNRKLRIIFWNVAGIGNKDEEFWEYLGSFDIINLTETWIEDKKWKKLRKTLPTEYRWEMQSATKDKVKGRSAGGMLVGVRKTLAVKYTGREKKDLMSTEIKVKEQIWKIISIYNRMGKKSQLEAMEEEIERSGWEKLIIGGDFNARIAERGSIAWYEEEEEEKRKSRDKVINKQGRDLLEKVEELGLGILNGNKRGDEEGELTFVGKLGTSVIDYAICNAETWEEIENMKIADRTESDHRPIELTLEVTMELGEGKGKEKEKEIEIEDWTDEGYSKYKDMLKERKEDAAGAREEWEELTREMRKAIQRKKIKKRNTVPGRRTWWDKQCRKSKTALNKLLREFLKDKIERKVYNEAKQEHQKLCKMKQEEERKKEQKKLMEIKDRNEVFKYVKKQRQTRENPDEEVGEEEWIGHFVSWMGKIVYKTKEKSRRKEVKRETGEKEGL